MFSKTTNKQFDRLSIRFILCALILTIGGWGMLASAYRIGDSAANYRQNRSLSEWARMGAKLLTAAQNLAYERGRTAVVMRAAGRISEADREFVASRRKQADDALGEVLAELDQAPIINTQDVKNQWDKVKQLRRQIDLNMEQEAEVEGKQLAGQWFDDTTTLIRHIQAATLRLVSYFDPGEKTTRLTLLAMAALELRITAGEEASIIAQAVASREPLAVERLNYIYRLRGREDRLWSEVERLSSYTGVPRIQKKVEDVKLNHISVFRQTQDHALKLIMAGNAANMSIERLTYASLPVLNGIADIMTLTTDDALKFADYGMAQSRSVLVTHIGLLVLLMVLIAASLLYVLKHVIKPIEFVDSEIKRLGALPDQACVDGNEIGRLQASTVALENILIARSEAEAEREKTIIELQQAIEQIKTLSGFLPICVSCKKIRDDKGYWEQVEAYITRHTDAQFSHGYCPECAKKIQAEIEQLKKQNSEKQVP